MGWQRRCVKSVLAIELLRSGQCHFFLRKFEVMISSIDQTLRNVMGKFPGDRDGVVVLILCEIELLQWLFSYC
jgi:hypothetical protein